MMQMSRAEMISGLRAERLKATQRILSLRKEIRERQTEIDKPESSARGHQSGRGLPDLNANLSGFAIAQFWRAFRR